MQRRPKTARSSSTAAGNPPRLDLSPDRAFVVHLDVCARPLRHLVGRVEHVTSGQVAHVASVRELLAFMEKVLGRQAADG